MMDLRGTGRSQGCLDHLGLRDARDLKQIVEWAATQRWSNGRVGMTGHYLQRRNGDGSWSGDLAVGGSSSTESETLESGRLAPGRYRLETHNWAGPPGTAVALELTFFDSSGHQG